MKATDAFGTQASDKITGTAADNRIYGANGNDELNGGTGNDTLYGGTGNDILYGGIGTDKLEGGADNDTLWGGAERDILTGGGGQDRFSFASKSESSNTVYDYITDFTPGQDKIDVSMIDANTKTSANDAFTFVPFAQSGKLGTITYTTHQGNGFVLADNDGVTGWDFVIQMQANLNVAKGDFIL